MAVRTLAFLVLRRVLDLIGRGPTPEVKDVEIAVLRHQPAVIGRQVARPRYTRSDRAVLATLAKPAAPQAFAHRPATGLSSHVSGYGSRLLPGLRP